MKKSQFEQLVREVIRETIRKVDGKYVVYPEKGGKRLGTHSTKKAAEKQLTAIHLNKEEELPKGKTPVDWEKRDWDLYEDVNIKYSKPNFDAEWKEAIRYPEFEEMGKDKWVKIANKGYVTTYSKISDELGNVDLDFDDLEEPKKQRFLDAFKKGIIEMSIAVKFSDKDYDLVAGNTRLAGLVRSQIDPKIWIVDISHLQENYADGKVNEQEMSQDDFNNVANTLRDSSKAKQIHSLLLQMFPQQKELLNYNYKNDSYAEFKRFIFFIDKYKLEGPVTINHTDLKLEPENMKDRERKYQDYITGKIDKYFRDTNADPRKVDLSKVPPITVDQNGFVTDGNHRAFLAIKQQKSLKGYKIVNANNTHPNVAKILQIIGREVKENYADGKVKGKSRPGRVKRSGASCKGSVTDLRAKAKKYGGEKGKMYHWCANMKSGRKK